MSKAGSKLIKSANQALAYARGESSDGFTVHVTEEIDVKSIRKSLGLTQPEFSSRFGFDVRAVQDWEQKRRQPDRPARILLTVIAHEPEAVSRALAHQRPYKNGTRNFPVWLDYGRWLNSVSGQLSAEINKIVTQSLVDSVLFLFLADRLLIFCKKHARWPYSIFLNSRRMLLNFGQRYLCNTESRYF